MKKYYIELASDYNIVLAQSKWYNTEEEALEFAQHIDFIHARSTLYLMSSVWDENEDKYTDIIQERIIKGGY